MDLVKVINKFSSARKLGKCARQPQRCLIFPVSQAATATMCDRSPPKTTERKRRRARPLADSDDNDTQSDPRHQPARTRSYNDLTTMLAMGGQIYESVPGDGACCYWAFLLTLGVIARNAFDAVAYPLTHMRLGRCCHPCGGNASSARTIRGLAARPCA